jgi:hypothetical protein
VIKHVKAVSPTALTIVSNVLKNTNSRKAFVEVIYVNNLFLSFPTLSINQGNFISSLYAISLDFFSAWLDSLVYTLLKSLSIHFFLHSISFLLTF